MSLFLADIDATCASLGYHDGNKYYAENDAVQGLKHIIWVLKRDQNEHEFRRYIGHKKIVQSDLLPMLIDYWDDEILGDVLLRLLVNLTNPALLLYKESLPKDGPGRRNYLDLVEILQDYKEAFISTKSWAVLAQKLQKNLEIDVAMRSEEQGLILERILVLIRNVLQVPTNPENDKRADNDASVHDQVLWTLQESGILDLILFILSSEYEISYHLHALEIVSLVYREQKADLLANALLQRSLAEKQEDEQKLISARKREQQIVKPPPARHSRFGGTYVARNMKSVSDRDIICHQALEKVVQWDFSREKTKQKRNFRIARENEKVDRQSVFSVRLFLREFCIEILTSAYNNLVKQVRRTLERNALAGHDDSYLMWAIRFFMEFNRLNGFQLHFVSESLSVSCIHWICSRIQYNVDQIMIDKRNKDLWNRRVQLGVQAYREILFSMQVLQQMNDENSRDLFDVLQNNIFYVVEYREIMLQLLLNFNENTNTKSHLRDVIDTANIHLKMMQKFCQGKVVVQKKTKKLKKRKPKQEKKEKPIKLTDDEKKEKTENDWQEIVDSLSVVLSNEINIPEEEHPLPFDAASDKSIDLQRGDCLKRIYKMLRDGNYEQAVLLLRAAREVWPDDDSFGKSTATPEEDLMFFKQIYIYISDSGLVSGDDASDNQDPSDNEGYSSNEEDDDNRVAIEEVNFSFEDFARRLLNPKIVRACTIVLKDWEKMTSREIKSTVTILHRIAFEHRMVAMLFQAQLFRVFQQVFHAPKDPRYDELRRLGQYVIRQFVKTVPSNPKIFAELLFFHSARDAHAIEFGYSREYEEPMKGAWNEEQEEELRRLFMENQENPQTDQDVIDWILDNLIDKTRTRRGVIKKLKELGLIFKAPTKKSTAAAANKKLFKPEEDQQLRELYDQFRLVPNALRRIMEMLSVKRRKSKVVERMVQLGLIADASEILPVKKSRNKQVNIGEGVENHSDPENESGSDGNESESETDDDDNNRSMSASVSRSIPSIKKAPNKSIKGRKVVVSKVDLKAINLLRNEIEELHKEAIDWIIESLNEAAEDFEEPSDDPDDGIPIVPIQDYQTDALQNEQFKKLMLAIGIQAPEKTETYWRIPANLTPSELQYRVQLLNNETSELNENEDDNYNSNDKRVLESDEEDVSEDMFNAWRKKSNEENHNLIYNESDDEEENKKKKNDNENDDKHSSVEHNKENLKGDTNEMDELNKLSITTKSRIKRKTIDSSDEEEEASTSINKINLSNLPNIHNGNEIDDVETDLNEKNNRSSKRERSSSSDNDGDANKDVKINQKQKKRIRRIVNSSDEDD